VNIDYSVVDKLHFDCVRNCGICCAFRPQLGDFEMDAIRSDPDICSNFIEETNERGEREYYLKLRDSGDDPGACAFLGAGKLCKVYPQRPFKCRLFPFFLRFGDGIQVDADLACSGFWYPGGKNAGAQARESMTDVMKILPEGINAAAGSNYEQTCGKLKEADLYIEKEECCRSVKSLSARLTEPSGLESIFLAGAGSQFSSQNIIDDLAGQLVESAFSGKARAVDFPLFIDKELKWEFFMLDGSDIAVKKFDETGAVAEVSRKPFEKPKLAPLPQDAKELLIWYLDILNSRQSTYDFALFSSVENMVQSVLSSYVHAVTLFVVETWAMAQLYSQVKGLPMDRYVFQKGIQAVDNSRVTGPAFDVI